MKKLLLSTLPFLFALNCFAQPSADFSWSSTSCNQVDFADLSSCSGGCTIVSWQWYFGDLVGQSTQPNPTYVYASPGSYIVSLVIYDSSQNADTMTITVIAGGGNLLANLSSTDATSCGACDGEIVPSASGGTPPYTYQWSNGATTSIISGLCAGVYQLTLTDANGCSNSASAVVTSPVLPLSVANIEHLDCYNDYGSIEVSVTGTGPFAFNWYDSQQNFYPDSSFIDSLPAETYSINVYDSASGCFASINNIQVVDSCGYAQGRVYNDLNANGIDDGEPGIPGVVIGLVGGTATGVSDASGNYYVLLPDTGNHTLTPISWSGSYAPCGLSYFVNDSLSFPSDSTHDVHINLLNPTTSGHDFGFYEPQITCGNISGHVFNDLNQNGVEDIGETGYNAINVEITNSAGQTIVTQTDANGDYSVGVPLDDTYEVSVAIDNTSYYCNYSSSAAQTFPTANQGYTANITSGNPTSTGNDFGLVYVQGFDAGIYNISAYYGINAGQNFTTFMDYKIFGDFTGTCTLRLEFDTLAHFNSASITPTTVGPDYLEWVYDGNTTTIPYYNCMGMNFTLDSSVTTGQILSWIGSFSCTDNDVCLSNNSFVRTYTAQTGPLKTQADYQGPVSMEVIHTGDESNGNISHDDSTFSYIINFQNTTADTIHHVFITNKISPYLDITSLSMPFSMPHHKLYVADEETIILEFDNLSLPPADSNWAKSYGFVQYNVRMKPDLPIGTVIENRAWVQYNYADSIPTNMVENEIVNPDGLTENTGNTFLNIYPNPSNDFITVQSQLENSQYSLYDIAGKEVISGTNAANTFRLDISELSSGVYFLKVLNGEKELNGKVVKD